MFYTQNIPVHSLGVKYHYETLIKKSPQGIQKPGANGLDEAKLANCSVKVQEDEEVVCRTVVGHSDG